MNSINNGLNKKKVVFIMGATGTGKSRLSVDLATHFPGEIINCDKMQVYKGLDIVTNKITDPEKQGVPHHLLGEIEPEADFTAEDFCCQAVYYIEYVLNSGHIPIIVGGSNTYIEALVENPVFKFKSKYKCCFLWVDVALPVLHSSVSKRVDHMVHAGLVDEVRGIFVPDADYTKGIRRSIGVPEMDMYLREENKSNINEAAKQILLESAIEEIKLNTCKLVCCQLEKIRRLRNKKMWPIHQIDATNVHKKSGKEADDAWNEMVLKPCLEIVEEFLKDDEKNVEAETNIRTMFPFKKLQVAI
ncbi:adenylate isopentenyltransferase 5, chloroplastic [Nicotiana attenuata]|uniref:adenylate dimethylallyltransferase (ADP/ATP-dependent) n=2 Tax=Nicotiana attenuata TaxID=49451 RepID=A0A1J6KJF3_NICAT|nr:adenylate isopentenyltransferase 5, chloroplastic [Nicotiana attenuata]